MKKKQNFSRLCQDFSNQKCVAVGMAFSEVSADSIAQTEHPTGETNTPSEILKS